MTPPLLEWLKREPLYPKVYWHSRENALCIAGAGASQTFHTIPRCDPSSQERFFGGLSFSERKDNFFPSCFFFVPQVILEGRPAEFQEENASTLSLQGERHSLSSKKWKEQVENYLSQIDKGPLQKVVAARKTRCTFSKEICPFQLLATLEKTASHATLFLFQMDEKSAFIGATPEKLYARKGRQLICEALAATAPLGEKERLDRPKERQEFEYVVAFLTEKLSHFCHSIKKEKERIITTTNLHHLYLQITATLNPYYSDQEIIQALHPTPAMAGVPTRLALELIQEETFARSWYAAPIGWISGQAAEIAVGIRSAYIRGNQIDLFAGAGIVSGSQPDLEWHELNQKIAPLLSALRKQW